MSRQTQQLDFLTNDDRIKLDNWGYNFNDIMQIDEAYPRTAFMIYDNADYDRQKLVTPEIARELLGNEDFLSGLSRSAFHYTTSRELKGTNFGISFDSTSLFEKNTSTFCVEDTFPLSLEQIRKAVKDGIFKEKFSPITDAFLDDFETELEEADNILTDDLKVALISRVGSELDMIMNDAKDDTYYLRFWCNNDKDCYYDFSSLDEFLDFIVRNSDKDNSKFDLDDRREDEIALHTSEWYNHHGAESYYQGRSLEEVLEDCNEEFDRLEEFCKATVVVIKNVEERLNRLKELEEIER